MESDVEVRPYEARTYELRPFERRGLKRSADHQPREFFREQVAKPLPWEWDLRRLTAHSFPITASSLSPATTGVGGLRAPRWLRDVVSLDDLMAKYAILHERILSGELPPRYVVFVSNPEYGYGNKIQVLVSTFVFALMSERAILIDWPQSLNVQMTHREDFKGAAPMVANLDHRELFEPPPGVQWDLTAPLRAQFTKAQQANATKQFREFPTIGVCEDLYKWEHDVEWVYISGWEFFATFLINNAHHDNVNRVLRPFHDQLLYVLANALRIIHPTRSIKSATESVRDRLFAPYRNEGILGIHLRTSHPEIPVTPSLIVQMIRCGLASGYKVWYLATEDKMWYNRFAKLLRQHDTGLAVDDFGSLNGTDRPEPRRRVKLLFLDRNVTERNTLEGTRNALSDMFLLMACDDFMMLWGTTFGRLVAAIGGFKEPITVMKHQRLCVRKLTSEPCIYTWDRLQSAPCYNNSKQLPSMLYSSDAHCREF